MSTTNTCRTAAMATLACLMAACGGGGGSSSPPPPPPVSYTVAIQYSTLQMNGDAAAGTHIAVADPISITSSTASSGPLYIRWRYTTRGISIAQLNGATLDALQFDVSYVEPDTLPNGDYEDTIQLDVAEDQAFTQPITGSPFTITSAYSVHGSTVKAVPPMAPTPSVHLSHDVLDAAISPSLDVIAMTSAAPDDALYLFDLATGDERKYSLPKPATALALSPDGRFAAVGHDALVSWVDLSTVGQATPAVQEFSVPEIAWSLVPDGQGKIHIFPATGQWVPLSTIDIAAGTVQTGFYATLFEKTRAKLHPAGDRVYTLETTVSPENMRRYTVGDGTLTRSNDMPYWDDWPLCADFWFSQGGDRIYTACGSTFASTADVSTDMIYTGALALTALPGQYAPAITSLSESAADGQVVLFDAGLCGTQGGAIGGINCDTLLRVDETAYGAALATYRLPLVFFDDHSAARQHGAFVFHGADGTVYTLSQAIDVDPAQAWFLDAPFLVAAVKTRTMAHTEDASHAAGTGAGLRVVARGH